MTKTATSSTLSPTRFATGNAIQTADIKEVIEQLNFTFQTANAVHCSFACATDDWAVAKYTNGLFGIEISGASYTEKFSFRIWIDIQVVTIQCEAGIFNGSGNTTAVKFTVGGANSATSQTSSSFETKELATASTGTGWQTVTIETKLTVDGGLAPSYLRSIRIENKALGAASQPDPPNE